MLTKPSRRQKKKVVAYSQSIASYLFSRNNPQRRVEYLKPPIPHIIRMDDDPVAGLFSDKEITEAEEEEEGSWIASTALPQAMSKDVQDFWTDLVLKIPTLLDTDLEVGPMEHDEIMDEFLRLIDIGLADAATRYDDIHPDSPRKKNPYPATGVIWKTTRLSMAGIEMPDQGRGRLDAGVYFADRTTRDRKKLSSNLRLLLEVKPHVLVSNAATGKNEIVLPKTAIVAVDLQIRARLNSSRKNGVNAVIALGIIGPFFRPYYWRTGAENGQADDAGRFPGHIRPSNANLVESTRRYYPSINSKCWVDVRTERGKLILQQVLLDTVLLGEGEEQPQFPELYGKEGNLASQMRLDPDTTLEQTSSSDGSASEYTPKSDSTSLSPERHPSSSPPPSKRTKR
jgi:hypothetical protein